MKVLTAPEMRAADERTFHQLGVPSRAVMEAAGRQLAERLLVLYPSELKLGVLIVAGPGNNGGDGFVLARALRAIEIPVTVFSLRAPKDLKGDAKLAAIAFENSGGSIFLVPAERSITAVIEKGPYGVVIDALLGTGARTSLSVELAGAIHLLNEVAAKLQVPLVSIDVPSGLDSDTGAVSDPVIRATLTLTLAAMKLGQLLSPGALCSERVEVIDIGVPVEDASKRILLTAPYARRLLETSGALLRNSHKGKRGHVLIIGGSNGKFGAPKLSGLAAFRCGAGLVTIASSSEGIADAEFARNEFMFESIAGEDGLFSVTDDRLQKLLSGKDAVVVGPGMGTGADAASLLAQILRNVKTLALPVVIDADALNILAAQKELRTLLDKQCVLTPHPGEMGRLLEVSVSEVEASRAVHVEQFARAVGAICVLKGAKTITANSSGELAINPAATPALGTAGSGDSLAGIIGALCAQGIAPMSAASLGVYVHGVAGELLETRSGGVFGVLAEDISRAAGYVLNSLRSMDFLPALVSQVLPDPFPEILSYDQPAAD